MARTPLMRTVLRLADRAFRDPAIDSIWPDHSRRRFLAVAALSSAGLALPGWARGPLAPPPRIAVVGGGLAGLTCAYRLAQAGYVSRVYEAADRLGGRCWSLRGAFDEDQLVERGGELIDTGHIEIRQLAQELDLDLDNLYQAEAQGTEPCYFFNGSAYSYDDATRDLKAIWQSLHKDLVAAGYPTTYYASTERGRELDQTSLYDWIDQNVPGGQGSRLGRLLDVAYNIEFGAETTDQSSLNMLYLLGYVGPGRLRIFGPSNGKYHVRGGNDQIVMGLGKALSGQIETGAELRAVRRDTDGTYTLTIRRGSTDSEYQYDHVVLAIPFPVLRESIDWSAAGFSAVKQTAILGLGMGTNTKLHVQFRTRHWNTLGCNGESYADTGYQASWEVTRAQPGDSGILVNYTGGVTGTDAGAGTPEESAEAFLDQIEPVMPGISAAWNGKAQRQYWADYPWTLGSYSYYRVGQYTLFGGAEAEREGNCHFAGEHASQDFQGYLQGAVVSGERAAAEILADLKAA